MPRRRRRYSRLNLFYMVLTTAGLIGGSLWLDHRGEIVNAVVKTKQEQITVARVPQGRWDRWHRVGVEFDLPDGASGLATVNLPERRYDALHPGDSIQIRYLSFFPLLARAADRSTADALWDAAARLGADPSLIGLLAWLVAGIVALWIAARVATSAVVVVGLAWIALAFPLIFPAPTPLAPVSVETRARVEAMTLVTKSPARSRGHRNRGFRGGSETIRRLAVPYQVIQLRFILPGRPDSVLAVDAVDSASVPGLRPGAMVPVRYDPNAPRNARLTQASRSFRERNRYHFLIPVIGVGLLGILGAWGWRTRRRRSSPPEPASAREPVGSGRG